MLPKAIRLELLLHLLPDVEGPFGEAPQEHRVVGEHVVAFAEHALPELVRALYAPLGVHAEIELYSGPAFVAVDDPVPVPLVKPPEFIGLGTILRPFLAG